VNPVQANNHEAEIARLQLALTAIQLLSTANSGVTTLLLRGAHGPARDALITLATQHQSVKRVPAHIEPDAIYGAIDAPASLAAGKAIRKAGLLSDPTHSMLVLCNTERWSSQATHALKSQLETLTPITKLILALDESTADEPRFTDTALADHFALHLEVPKLPLSVLQNLLPEMDSPTVSTDPAPESVQLTDTILRDWVALAQQLGISSLRVVHQASVVARALAANQNRTQVNDLDSIKAVQLVIGPRAQQALDTGSESADEAETPAEPSPEESTATETAATNTDTDSTENNKHDELPEQLIAAAQAALPSQLLAGLASHQRTQSGNAGRDASKLHEHFTGRPTGIRRAKRFGRGERLNLLATLREAAPWQTLRKATPGKVVIYPDDLRVTRYAAPVRNTTVFIVDASGSAALHRLAEAKGAVELLLNECYVRRDRVALITFRGEQASIDLPPTRSLVRAKRALQGLPGGGGTPLAAGLQLANRLLTQLERSGESTVAVVLSDGKANVALNGTHSRQIAKEDAEIQARHMLSLQTRCLFVDTAPRPLATAKHIADAMQAQYMPLPHGQNTVLAGHISALSAHS